MQRRSLHRDTHVLQPVEAEVNQVTEKVIGSGFKVLNTLGPGFLEKVYENALALEIRSAGLAVCQQQPVPVYY